MGFLKRIFSIGSKKNKKRPQIVHDVDSGLRGIWEEEEHEATVGRLLRSSSTRFAVVSELDYTSLPPLPHPINEVVQTPAASTISLASTSTSQRGTYNVTVHRRKQHTLTEFPNANRDLDGRLTPEGSLRTPTHSKDNSHLLGLRSDPSVASLLDMYDEHGCIPAEAFSNSPPSPRKEGRAQTQRSGSTLRQLLGNPSSLNSRTGNDASEGDISWAERFLGEADGASSTSSLGEPITPDALFFNTDLPRNHIHDNTFTSDHDLSTNTYDNPAISSMEVELSIGADSLPPFNHPSKDRNPYGNPDVTTPQRASQVFGFLISNRRQVNIDDQDRSLHELLSTFSVSSNQGSPPNEAPHSHFSSDGSSESVYGSLVTSAMPIPPNDTLFSSRINSSDTQSIRSSSYPSDTPRHPVKSSSSTTPDLQILRTNGQRIHEAVPDGIKHHEVKVIMNRPTKVVVTAPTPSANHEALSRISRGPRAQQRRSSARGMKVRRSATLAERSNSNANSVHSKDMFTPVLSRRKSHYPTSSRGSSSTISYTGIEPPTIRPAEKSSRSGRGSRSILAEIDKENDVGLSVKNDMPCTPLRSKSTSSSRDSRSLFRAAVDPSVFRPPVGMPPSPASSSELSPVGRQLMVNLRQQRAKAREADRQKSQRFVHVASRPDFEYK